MKSKYTTLFKNIGLFFIASFIPKAISFFLVPLYTRCLTTEDYGTVDLLVNTVQLIIPFLTLQIQDAVLRFSMDLKYDKSDVFSIGFNITLNGGILIILAAIVLETTGIILLPMEYWIFFIITYFTGALNNIFSYFCRGIGKIKILTASSIITSVVTVGLNLFLLLVLKLGLVGYLASNAMGQLTNILIMYFGAGLGKYKKFRVNNHAMRKEMIFFSIPMIFSAISWWINNASDRYILTYFSGVSVVGIYAVASKIPTIISTLSSVVSKAYSISAIKELDKDDGDGFLGKSYALISCCSVLACSFLIITNVFLSRILFSNDFFSAWLFVPPLLLAALMNQLSLSCENLLIALKNTKLISITAIIAAMLNTVLNFILIPKFGAYGAAIATVAAFSFQWLLRFLSIKKHIKLKNYTIIELATYFLLLCQMILGFWGNAYIIVEILLFILIFAIYANKLIPINKSILHKKPKEYYKK